tara:strand:- start:1024 stop:2127 length:1104 start_codon:yes stop_codon:yes gene_type:complete
MSTRKNKSNIHSYYMKLALSQANIILGNTGKNPAVGCVITKNNHLLSAAHTSFNGRPHAEANAIKLSKNDISNSNIYVTLEPCSHYGKTPPCVNFIIKKKIKNVFFSIKDPDLRSFNKAIKILKKKRIKVQYGICSKKINNFYNSYIKSKKNTFPFVTCKLAASKDLFTINNKKKWITNKYSRSRVHLMRSYHDCILTSSETVIRDNPTLTCRIDGLEKFSPVRIVLDKKLRIPINSEILKNSLKYKTIIFYNYLKNQKIQKLKKLKIKLYRLPVNKNGDIDLKILLYKIKKLGFSRIFVESGLKLASSFFKNDLVDDFKLFLSNTHLKKNGKGSLNEILNSFLKNKKKAYEKVNLFGDKLISYKIK